jgi:hypothetical protein
MAKLNAADRKALPPSKFALPDQRKDPIPNKSHAEEALTMGMRDASPAEKAEIRSNVHKAFPGVGKTAKDDKKDTPMGKMVRGALSKK